MQKLPEVQQGPVPAIPDVPRHPISRAAQTAGVHPQTLRDYDRRGLLQPARTHGGKRLYTDRDIERAQRIRVLTEEGIPVQASRRLLRLEELLQLAMDRIHVLEDQNRRLSGRLQQIQLARG